MRPSFVRAVVLLLCCGGVVAAKAAPFAYVSNEGSSSVSIIDTATDKVVSTMKIGQKPRGIAISPDGKRLYISDQTANALRVIDTDKNEVVGRYPVKQAGNFHPVVIDEPNHRLFVGCRKAPMLVVLDSESGKELAGIPIPGEIDDLYLDSARKRLYACCGEGYLAVIKQQDADRYEVQEKIPTAKGAKTCFFDADSGRLYLAVPRQEGKEGPEIRVYQARP